MTIGRLYRAPLSNTAAQSELIRCSGSQFDPEIIKAMVNLLKRF